MTASPDCNCTVCMRVECMCAPVTVARTVRICAVTVCCQNNIAYHILGVCHRLWRTLKVWYVMLIWQNAMTASPDCNCNSHRHTITSFIRQELEVQLHKLYLLMVLLICRGQIQLCLHSCFAAKHAQHIKAWHASSISIFQRLLHHQRETESLCIS